MNVSINSQPRSTYTVIVLSIYASSFYIFMEWLFFMTKPSFMDSFDNPAIFSSFFISVLWLSLLSSILILVIAALQKALNISYSLIELIPAFMLGSSALLLVDNFTYTLKGFGIVHTKGLTSFVYLFLYTCLIIRAYTYICVKELHLVTMRKNHFQIPIFILVTISGLFVGINFVNTSWSLADVNITPLNTKIIKPNIIFLGSDGLSANEMSAYGHPKPTTPFLEKFSRNTLFFENAFPNAGQTPGSTTSLLTGRRPETVKVGYLPQILPKQFSIQHFPAILRKLGYSGYQQTIRYYADSLDLNMQSAFTFANGRKTSTPISGTLSARFAYLFNSELYFFQQMYQRLSQRLFHITGLKDMRHFVHLVRSNEEFNDSTTIENAKIFIQKQKGKPFFMHLHLMETHCCDHEKTAHWFKPDDFPIIPEKYIRFYDHNHRNHTEYTRHIDSIRETDELMKQFITWLDKQKFLNTTILVIYSDHSYSWDSTERIPLMIHFPGKSITGRISENISLLDIPPTILEYMKIHQPDWMTGRSFLHKNLSLSNQLSIDKKRPIFSLNKFNRFRVKDSQIFEVENPSFPLYGVEDVAMIICQKWYKLSLITGHIESEIIPDHTAPCNQDELPSLPVAKEMIAKHMETSGFLLPFRNKKDSYNKL